MMGGSNSLTRLDFPYNASGYAVPTHEISKGYVRMSLHNGIVQTWAINRPLNVVTTRAYAPILRGGATRLVMPRPNRAMDPTNPATWQRPYIFTV